jgi:hypothetical protein
MAYLQIPSFRYQTIETNVTDPRLYIPGVFRAAILNNVLYTLPPDQKELVIRGAATAIQRRGRLIIGEPLPATTLTPARRFEFYSRNLESALEVGAPLEDFSLVAMLAVNLILHDSPEPRYYSEPEELIRMATAAGLRLVSQGLAYFDGASFLVFRKP